MTPSISAILIAKDEERDLPGCLDSLKGLASEIVVVISEDTSDRTEEIARAAGAKTARRKFDDYARQRQASLDAAAGEWCLWIDPDERVTPALAAEIRSTLAARSAAFVAYDIPFEVRFLGATLRWGGLGSESHVRLFRRAKSRFVGGGLHEGIEIEGAQGRLAGKIVHEPYRDIPDYLGKLDRYTTLAAEKRFAAGRRFSALRHLILPWEFFSRVVLKLGILDGRPGLVWAGLSSYHSWLKWVKVGELQRRGR
ncbi:MAG TPA: glycosyltransferase family 2 protein [Elusimicrobiota bacterium]|nr:glycosyltransferase family 2 protein [Elusimicrobiota bacterium]